MESENCTLCRVLPRWRRRASPCSGHAAFAIPLAPLVAQSGGTFWLPSSSSTMAGIVDQGFYLILGISTFFFLLIVALMLWFVVRYRRRPGCEPSTSPSHNTPLEIVWTVIPLVLVGIIFSRGFTGYMEMRIAPENAYEIRVTAQKWSWNFTYPNGYEDKDLHVPLGEPVRLIMESRDVIHSLFIPAFRVKMDIVPGRYTSAWFQATEEGIFDLQCTEYCGTGHSDMLATVVVQPPERFRQWLADAAEKAASMNPVDAGRRIYTNRCAVCHSIEQGVTIRGPSLSGIFGQSHRFTDGTSARVDDNYLRESLVDPSAKIREGFTDQMPSFRGVLKDPQITAVIEFIKSLK